MLDHLVDSLAESRVLVVGIGSDQREERQSLVAEIGHGLRKGCLGPPEQPGVWIEIGQNLLGPDLLVASFLARQVPRHDRCLELPAHDIPEIGPVMGRLSRIGPEDVEVRQPVLIHHVVEVVVGSVHVRLDGERQRTGRNRTLGVLAQAGA